MKLNGRVDLGAVIAASCVVITCYFLSRATHSVSADTPPIVEVSRPDLGDLISPQIAEFTLPIMNVSDQPLQITELVPACNCTSATVQVNSLPPKRTGTLRIRYDNSAKTGKVDLLIYLFAKGYKHPTRVDFLVNNVPECPSSIDMGTILDNQKASEILVRARAGMQALVLRSLNYDRRVLNIDVRKDSQGNIALDVRPSSGAQGTFASTIEMTTNDVYQPAKRVTVYGDVPPQITASPAEISLGVVSSSTHAVRNVHIVSPYGQKFRILSVKTSDIGASVYFDKSLVSSDHPLGLQYRCEKKSAGDISILASVKTDERDTPVVKFKIFGIKMSSVD